MLLIDTSVWLDFFSDSTSPSAVFIEDQLNNNNPVGINAVIEMEILQGIRDDKDFERMRLYLRDFQYFPEIDAHYFGKSVEIYRACRKKGVTVRKSLDCLIAANCLIDNLTIVHRDRDFSSIAKVFKDLKCIRVD